MNKMMTGLLLGLSLPGAAIASGETLVVSAGGGYDYATATPWTGVEAAVVSEARSGFSFVGRARSGVSFWSDGPQGFGRLEAGFVGVHPGEHAVFRFGVVAGTSVQALPWRTGLGVGVSDATRDRWLTFLPTGQALIEVGGPVAPSDDTRVSWALGVQAGVGPAMVALTCEGETEDEFALCGAMQPGFAGGVTGRLMFRNGLALQAVIGPDASLNVGYSF